MRCVTWSVLALASTAGAAPLAQLDATLDGKPAHVAVDNGALAVDGKPVLALPDATAAALEARDAPRGPTIVATITTARGQQAIGLEKHGTWREIFRVPVGAADPDGDTGIAVALLPNGAHRYQTRPSLHRCDGQPALFFAEGWTGAKFRRLASMATLVDPAAPALTAHPDASPAPAPLLFHATIASREAGAGDVADLTVPTAIDDGDPSTAWRDAGRPAGQFITFEPRGAAKATEVRLVAAAGGALPQRIAIVGAHAAYHVDVPGAGPAFSVELPAPIDGCVTAVIESAQPAAIAELDIYGDGERAGGGEAMLAAIVASGADGAMAAEQALAGRGAAAVTALDAVLGPAKTSAARTRIVHALIATKDPSAGAVLAKAVRELELDDATRADLLAALGAFGQTAVLAQLAATRDLGVPARIAAVQAIASAPGDPSALLVPLAGDGPAPLRKAIIDALAAVPAATLAAAAAAAQPPQAAGDLWRALTRRGHAVAAERAAAVAALLQALPAAADYERRYRIFDGVAELGDAPALAQITAALHALPEGADRAAFAHVAALALARAPRPEALPLAAELLHDADPGVRYAAITALADDGWFAPAADGAAAPATARGSLDGAIAAALAGDAWPEVRRHAAEALGTRCLASAPAQALAAALASDPDVTVRDGALGALVQCNASGTSALLARVWDDARQPLELRRHAIDLADALGDPSLGPVLVQRLAAWRGAALDSSDALALAETACYAIGKLGPPGAAEALLAALGDSAYPEIVAAAAAGLGLLGPACPAEAVPVLQQLAHSEEREIAVAAAGAAVQCGKPRK